MRSSLQPLFKWTGGKRKELPKLQNYYPSFVASDIPFTFVEPFVGGGAAYWNISASQYAINDFDFEIVNFYTHVAWQNQEFLQHIQAAAAHIAAVTDQEKSGNLNGMDAKRLRGLVFYDWRNLDRKGGLYTLPHATRAARFFIVNQLAFNGMRRFNSRGEFNIPYGNYKSLSNVDKLSDIDYLTKLSNTHISCGDFEAMFKQYDKPNTFIFCDPPYVSTFSEYSHENKFELDTQERLANAFKSLQHASALIVINKCDTTMQLYGDYIKDSYPVNYSTNIKNRYSNEAEHLVITNYSV